MRARALGAVALAVGLAFTAGGCGGSDEPRPDLLLVSTRDGYYAIYELNADGERQRRLSDADVDATDQSQVFFQIDPAWARDATRIAYASRRGASFDIYSMLADGSDAQQLTTTKENEVHPTWSPDGESIAFARSDPGRLYVMNADGTNARRVTDDVAEEIDPAWSPDGEWIAYSRRTPGTSNREVWLVRLDGSERHAVTDLGYAAFGPTWSPDSKRIAFAVDVEQRYDIHSIGVDGKGLQRHTRSTTDAFEPSWSPDGQTIAYSSDGAIFTVDLDGATEELTDKEDNDSSPAWNPVAADDDEEES